VTARQADLDPLESRRRFALHQATQVVTQQPDQGPEDLARQVLIAARIFEAYAAGREPVEPRGPLSGQQVRVLELLAAGLTLQACARRLAIGEATVKSHLRDAVKRLGVETRIEAILAATRLGLIGIAS
jgi:DNA-binding NarL/FixJ family response regulator